MLRRLVWISFKLFEILTCEGNIVQLFECTQAAANITLAIEDTVQVQHSLALQGEYVAHTVGKSNLVAHYLGHVLQKFVECAKFLVVNSNHCTLEEFITM